MAPWIIPALKAVLPHIGTIVSAARPVFTTLSGGPSAAVIERQIGELQAVAAQNAAHIRELAEQLQNTVAAIEQGASAMESRLRRALIACAAACVVAVVAAAASLAAWLSG
jgi:hypothetical protein